jgi:hypothetical protein
MRTTHSSNESSAAEDKLGQLSHNTGLLSLLFFHVCYRFYIFGSYYVGCFYRFAIITILLIGVVGI